MTRSQAHNKGKDEVYEWIEHIQKNPDDEEVKEKIVLRYKKLVESLARKYSKNTEIHEDLVQVGMLGLLGAINRFDLQYEKAFESFAIPTILGEIKRYIRDQTWSVHVPRRIKELDPKIKKASEALTNLNQRAPTIKEIAKHIGTSEEAVLETMEMSRSYHALSVDRKINTANGENDAAIIDLVGNKEDNYNKVDQQMLLEKVLPILSKKERQILKCTYFNNMSQKETGELLGISQMHVSRLQRRSLKKLRDAVPYENMEIYLQND